MYVQASPYETGGDDLVAKLCQAQIFFSLLSSVALSYDKDKLAASRTPLSPCAVAAVTGTDIPVPPLARPLRFLEQPRAFHPATFHPRLLDSRHTLPSVDPSARARQHRRAPEYRRRG